MSLMSLAVGSLAAVSGERALMFAPPPLDLLIELLAQQSIHRAQIAGSEQTSGQGE
jgi:hypothetical protein